MSKYTFENVVAEELQKNDKKTHTLTKSPTDVIFKVS